MATDLERVNREREHFDTLAMATGESWWGHTTPAGRKRLRRRAEILGRMLPDGDPLDVLEVGCGTGPLTVELLAQLDHVRLTATDLSPASVEIAERRCREFPHVAFEVQDVTDMSYRGHAFDAVVGNSILHHVPAARALAEIFRVLRPGGRIVFFEPNLVNPQHAFDFGIAWRWRARRLQFSDDECPFFRWPLRRAILNAGFGLVSVEPMDFLHPLTPAPLTGIADRIGRVAEQIPLVREISGSLLISAVKPIAARRAVEQESLAGAMPGGFCLAF